jgi:hypothetical protein
VKGVFYVCFFWVKEMARVEPVPKILQGAFFSFKATRIRSVFVRGQTINTTTLFDIPETGYSITIKATLLKCPISRKTLKQLQEMTIHLFREFTGGSSSFPIHRAMNPGKSKEQ